MGLALPQCKGGLRMGLTTPEALETPQPKYIVYILRVPSVYFILSAIGFSAVRPGEMV